MKRNLFSVLVKIVVATGKNDFGCSLHMHSAVVAMLSLPTVLDNC
jgi:hypothetical protein